MTAERPKAASPAPDNPAETPSGSKPVTRQQLAQLIRGRLADRTTPANPSPALASSPPGNPPLGSPLPAEDLHALTTELQALHQTAAQTVELLLGATAEISRHGDPKNETSPLHPLLLELKSLRERLDALAKTSPGPAPDPLANQLARRLRPPLLAATWFSLGALAASLVAGYYGWNSDRFMRTLNANQHRLYATFKQVCGEPPLPVATPAPSRRP